MKLLSRPGSEADGCSEQQGGAGGQGEGEVAGGAGQVEEYTGAGDENYQVVGKHTDLAHMTFSQSHQP